VALTLPPAPPATTYVLAWSGGRDSTVLLHALRAAGLPLRAVHVHHGLQAAADRFEAHCRSVAAQWRLPLEVCRVRPVEAGQGQEAAARDARYAALWSQLAAEEVLVTAHHAQDQVETLLSRLFRGTGIEGLRGIAVLSTRAEGRLWRPLLSTSPDALAAYARVHALSWVEDPQNQDRRYERVWLRQAVLPLLRERLPALDSSLLRLAGHAADVVERLQAPTASRLSEVRHPDGRWGPAWSIPALRAQAPAERRALLRAAWAETGAPPLSAAQLDRVEREVIGAGGDRQPELQVGGWVWRRYRDALYCLRPRTPPILPVWAEGQRCVVPGLGVWEAETPPASPLQLRYATGGERFRPVGEAHRRRVKALFQAAGVPPWQRALTPLLWRGDQLIAVAGVAQSADAPRGLRWRSQGTDAPTRGCG
jgi:tRNA(Ile)-lysidine synthase